MQRCTTPGGYNLIVAAMDTVDTPARSASRLPSGPGELSNYYEGWQFAQSTTKTLVKLHRTDENGNRIVALCHHVHASPLNGRPATELQCSDRRPRTTTAVKLKLRVEVMGAGEEVRGEQAFS